MRAPSLSRLEAAFPGKGAELRALLKGEVKTYDYLSVQDLQRACYHAPGYTYRLMTALNEIIEGCGIGVLRDRSGSVVAEYVNTGDVYNVTLIVNRRGTVMITTVGDYVESNRNVA